MQCVVCSEASSYNRAVIDVVNESELGALCPACEDEHFGRSLETGDWTDEDCALCTRDGFYALPEWRAYVVEIDGKRIARSEYSLEPPVPHLCDVHFTEITGETSSRTVTPAVPSSQ